MQIKPLGMILYRSSNRIAALISHFIFCSFNFHADIVSLSKQHSFYYFVLLLAFAGQQKSNLVLLDDDVINGFCFFRETIVAVLIAHNT